MLDVQFVTGFADTPFVIRIIPRLNLQFTASGQTSVYWQVPELGFTLQFSRVARGFTYISL